MWILGISAFYHDSAAALIKDGRIIAAVQEERFSRKKHDPGFPINAIKSCLEIGNIKLTDINQIVFYDKPFLKFERLLETYLANAPFGLRSFLMSMPIWLKEKLFQKRLIIKNLQNIDADFDPQDKLLFSEHHISHAASAFYPSSFDKSLILTMDGVGEWATTSVMIGEDKKITPLKEIHFPDSLGLLYSAFTYFTGFRVNSGEYKLMGLAPYGKPRYVDIIKKYLIDIKPDGSFRLDMRYFNYCTGLTMVNKRFAKLFDRPRREPEEKITQSDMDLARSIQEVTEEVITKIAKYIRQEYGIPNLCLAGGVALNCVANGKLFKQKIFDQIWIQPAAGDAGGAIGAALYAYHSFEGKKRVIATKGIGDAMQGSYLGPEYSDDVVKQALDGIGAKYEYLQTDELIGSAAKSLSKEDVVGWFQGRMEFGPRALGNRSILGDPRSGETQSVMNLKIKFRESFRPFAPSVLSENVSDYFEFSDRSPYMLFVSNVKAERRNAISRENQSKLGIDLLSIPKSDIPAVTHVDYSARIQTVHHETNPMYHRLITRFKELTGYGLLVNTSFNVRGEPIVCTPEDAFRCFMGTDMDELYIGHFRLRKKDQNPEFKIDYKEQFAAD